MRLQVSFLTLLLTASIATSFVWREFTAARYGDDLARVMIFSLALLAAGSMVLLARIVIKVKSMSNRRE